MKTLTYEYEKMLRAGQLLNTLVVSGSSNFRTLAQIADILDSGVLGEMDEDAKDGEAKEGGNSPKCKKIDWDKIPSTKTRV